MASRGFIFASVDENFLNSAWSNIWDELEEENDCRAWLLLKHLECWREWNEDPKNPFYAKVDLDRISLIGHSRGGEAVAIAACFNQLPVYPDDADVKFDFRFNIRSVIAIAPVDGQYKPARTGTSFENVSYLTLQGSNDFDMQSFHGSRQFQRISFTDDNYHVKAGLYIFGANHGQFNTVWGRNDYGFPAIARFNKKQLIPPGDQQAIGKVFISAFLEATLNERIGYFDLLRDYRSGLEWLPETVYFNQFEDSNCDMVCTFEEDINLYTATTKNWRIETGNLTVWKESMVPLKWREQDTRAVFAGWNLEATDSVPGIFTVLREPGETTIPGAYTHLYFVVADAGEDSNPHPEDERKNDDKGEDNDQSDRDKGEKRRGRGAGNNPGKTENNAGDEAEDKEQEEPYDLTIQLTDGSGNTASLPLSHIRHLQRQLETKLMKAGFMDDGPGSELVFQAYFFPLADFESVNPSFDSHRISRISFIFDGTGEGVLVIDNIGFWKPPVYTGAGLSGPSPEG